MRRSFTAKHLSDRISSVPEAVRFFLSNLSLAMGRRLETEALAASQELNPEGDEQGMTKIEKDHEGKNEKHS